MSLLAISGLRISEALGADIDKLRLERGQERILAERRNVRHCEFLEGIPRS